MTIVTLLLTGWYMYFQIQKLFEITDPSFTYNEFYFNLATDIPADLTAG